MPRGQQEKGKRNCQFLFLVLRNILVDNPSQSINDYYKERKREERASTTTGLLSVWLNISASWVFSQWNFDIVQAEMLRKGIKSDSSYIY